MPIYFTGKIYAIKCNETDDVYIGSTIQTLKERLGKHRRDMKRWKDGKGRNITSFEIVQYDSCYIELLETYPCNSKEELLKKEKEYIESIECINKCRPFRTDEEKKEYDKEYAKEYREANKERVLQQHKEYYEANKEKVLQYQKEYYEEKRKEKNKEKYTCVCGSNIRKSDRRKHERTKKHGDYIKELQENADPVNLNEFFEQLKFKVSM